MPLLQPSSNFAKRLKLDGRTGLMVKVEREEDQFGNFSTVDGDSMKTAEFIFDPGSMTHGWADFKSQPPHFVMVPEAEDAPEKPEGGNHMYNVRVNLFLDGEDRELGTSARGVIRGLSNLMAKAAKAPELAKGLLPIVNFSGTTVTRGGIGPSHIPQFEITEWVERPDEFLGS